MCACAWTKKREKNSSSNSINNSNNTWKMLHRVYSDAPLSLISLKPKTRTTHIGPIKIQMKMTEGFPFPMDLVGQHMAIKKNSTHTLINTIEKYEMYKLVRSFVLHQKCIKLFTHALALDPHASGFREPITVIRFDFSQLHTHSAIHTNSFVSCISSFRYIHVVSSQRCKRNESIIKNENEMPKHSKCTNALVFLFFFVYRTCLQRTLFLWQIHVLFSFLMLFGRVLQLCHASNQ